MFTAPTSFLKISEMSFPPSGPDTFASRYPQLPSKIFRLFPVGFLSPAAITS
jgi:hypothetical protein